MRSTLRPHSSDRAAMNGFERISHDPKVMGGKPCIKGKRVTVGMVVSQIATGQTVDEFLAAYPYIEREDVFQALRYAAWRSDERDVELESA